MLHMAGVGSGKARDAACLILLSVRTTTGRRETVRMETTTVMLDSLNRRILSPYGCDWGRTPHARCPDRAHAR